MNGPRRWTSTADHVTLTAQHPAPRIARMESLPQSITVDLARSALVVIDMQNDFCTPGGWLDSIGVDVRPAAAAATEINTITPLFRAVGAPIIWLNWANRPDLANLPPNVVHVYDGDGTGGGIGERAGSSDAVLTEGSWGAAIIDALDVQPSDLHIGKFRMSGFWDTALDSVLRTRGIDSIFFAGVNADQCVLATLTDAACIGYDCILVEGASATTSPGFCLDATLYNVRQCFGFTVSTAALAASISA
ncbi:cysteine hydrolase family protein [Subtercola frigoramans]|uniref:Nicotinamidase-related amidase n=1 Tax=Subtercola frigoramans TaxID=120298 RepID=A0ABS2L212_9MICO|nr:isochorismatase family cysteine hydrolase [Subtercola frigoramans]MBM7471112.1 nicotinamidase-related amidase [Subtercola frigoramans]